MGLPLPTCGRSGGRGVSFPYDEETVLAQEHFDHPGRLAKTVLIRGAWLLIVRAPSILNIGGRCAKRFSECGRYQWTRSSRAVVLFVSQRARR
jgi:hypothetical protein